MNSTSIVFGNYDWRPLYRIGAVAPLITIALYLIQFLVIIPSVVSYPTTPESWFALFHQSTFLGMMFLALCAALWRAGPAHISIAAFFAFLGITVFVSPRAVSVSGAVGFVQRERGGTILILLSLVMLLVGGGFVSSFIGIIAGAAGTQIYALLTWWRARQPSFLRLLAMLWPWAAKVSRAKNYQISLKSKTN